MHELPQLLLMFRSEISVDVGQDRGENMEQIFLAAILWNSSMLSK
jgi:hypothetical protein